MRRPPGPISLTLHTPHSLTFSWPHKDADAPDELRQDSVFEYEVRFGLSDVFSRFYHLPLIRAGGASAGPTPSAAAVVTAARAAPTADGDAGQGDGADGGAAEEGGGAEGGAVAETNEGAQWQAAPGVPSLTVRPSPALFVLAPACSGAACSL